GEGRGRESACTGTVTVTWSRRQNHPVCLVRASQRSQRQYCERKHAKSTRHESDGWLRLARLRLPPAVASAPSS
ncbi:Spermadhesin Z13, partial [Frankliniella fusca]